MKQKPIKRQRPNCESEILGHVESSQFLMHRSKLNLPKQAFTDQASIRAGGKGIGITCQRFKKESSKLWLGKCSQHNKNFKAGKIIKITCDWLSDQPANSQRFLNVIDDHMVKS